MFGLVFRVVFVCALLVGLVRAEPVSLPPAALPAPVVQGPAPKPQPSPFSTLMEKNGQAMFIFDITPLEFSGEVGHQTYDLTAKIGNDTHFIGSANVPGGTFYGGGLNLGMHYASSYGLRGGFELGVMAGRMTTPQLGLGLDASSLDTRARVVVGLGFQHRFGRFILHTETQAGFDYSSVDLSAPLPVFSTNRTVDASYNLSRYTPRFGQQAGVHLIIGPTAALFVQANIDTDGQYRVNAGVALGTWK